MPLNNPSPQFGLLTEYDMRAYSGVEVFDRSGGSAVSLETYNSAGVGHGIFEDLIFFLNRRTSPADQMWQGQADLVNTFGTSWSVTINEDDKVIVVSDADFEIRSTGTVDALGFGSSVVSAVLTGFGYVATAPNDWTRGSLDLADVIYTIDEVSGSSTFNFPAVDIHMQDVTVGMRNSSTINDADGFTTLASLEELDRAANTGYFITWFIDDSGRVNCSYVSGAGDISWSSTEIRDLLGFTGNETPVGTAHKLLTATYKASGVLIPSRPYQSHHLREENVAQARRLIGGGYTSNYIGTYVTSVLRFALDALLDSSDDYRHFTDRWVPFCSPGERVNFYQGWGDSRRSLPTASVNSSQFAYDTLYTSEDNGEYGRMRGSLTTESFDLVYPSSLKRRVPVTMEIEHL
jgi:hypothetical protein